MIAQLSKRMMSWDAAVMVSHWLLAICFVGAVVTQDSEKYRLLHVTIGYTMFGLVAFRLVWGFIGGIMYFRDCRNFEPYDVNKLTETNVLFDLLFYGVFVFIV